MTNSYIGFRIEIASRSVPSNMDKIVRTYNAAGHSSIIMDLKTNGKIAVNKASGMIMACGDIDKRKFTKSSAMINFALMIAAPETKELERLIQIINVLGDGRLIRERVKTFVDGKSILNKLPELKTMEVELKRVEHYVPGFTINGWYYAPEAIFG